MKTFDLKTIFEMDCNAKYYPKIYWMNNNTYYTCEWPQMRRATTGLRRLYSSNKSLYDKMLAGIIEA